MFRFMTALAIVATAACGTDAVPPDGATHTSDWHCNTEECVSPLSDKVFAAVAAFNQGAGEVLALSWTADGDLWFSYNGAQSGSCWLFDAGIEDGIPRDPFRICDAMSSQPDVFIGNITWGDSDWSVTLIPIER